MRNRNNLTALLLMSIGLLASGCGVVTAPAPAQPARQEISVVATETSEDRRLKVIATTTILGDVVRNVGGDAIDLAVLLPIGADPHSFEPAPADVAAVGDADVVFVNGLGLEQSLAPIFENAGARVAPVSDGIALIEGAEDAEEPGHEGEEEHEHGATDPHTWTDPNNVLVWVDNIERTLRELDPANAETFAANAAAYKAQLQELDAWIHSEVATLAEADRKLVTDHAVFGYFAHRYGFEQTGTVMPGSSTLTEPSAQDIAALEDTLRQAGVRAIFVGNTVNSALSERIADDTGVQLVFVYTDSLSEPGGLASTYLDYMRHNVETFVGALR
jgi:ABC-type Zn uptake system ZnuABC Zn-binding protein ZnuA